MVSCVDALLLGFQVACHWPPLRKDNKLSGGSPFENETTTLPLFSALPQSSTTFACSASGHPAGTVKDCPIDVRVGISLLGVQLDARPVSSGCSAALEAVAGAFVTIKCNRTSRTLPSENCSVR